MSIALDSFFPFDQGQGLNASQPRWRLMARLFYGSGVVPGYLNQFNATLAGGVLTIQSGGAWIDGFYGETAGNKALPVTNGTVVARMDPTGRQIIFALLPTPQQPTQNLTDIYEIPLWVITGTSLSDARQFANAVPGKAARGKVHRVAGYGTSTTPTIYGFDTIEYGSNWSSGSTFVCPYAADYLCHAQVGFATTGAGQWYNVKLMHNNVSTAWSGTPFGTLAGSAQVCQATDVIPCKAGDTLQVQHQCSTTGLQGYVGADRAYFVVRALV
jgi:hypothetical protein